MNRTNIIWITFSIVIVLATVIAAYFTQYLPAVKSATKDAISNNRTSVELKNGLEKIQKEFLKPTPTNDNCNEIKALSINIYGRAGQIIDTIHLNP